MDGMDQPAVVFAAVFAALYAAHQVADHWTSTEHQATHKGLPGWAGRRACAAHVATYVLFSAAVLAATAWRLGLHLDVVRVCIALAVSALTHYWADRRTTLARLCERLGKGTFYRVGQPRPGTDDQPHLGTGAYVLDQSWHILWGVLIAALIIA